MSHYRVGLLFNANKAYDRQVIEGIGEFFAVSECNWDIYIEDAFCTTTIPAIISAADGIIADLDDPDIAALLADSTKPYIGVGSSFASIEHYPQCDYVATDNYALVQLAFEHLLKKGLQHIAFFSMPPGADKKWAAEREKAYRHLAHQHYVHPEIYTQFDATIQHREASMHALVAWLQRLPTRTGIIAVTDSRARHLLQACAIAGINVPDDIAVIGIDNEEMVNYLSRISLTTVMQGTRRIGFIAAQMLYSKLQDIESETTRLVVVPPGGVKERMSTNVQQASDPLVARALTFIRENIHKPLKVIHILNYLGVSRTLIDNKFEKALGCKVHAVILKEKIRTCRGLLENRNIPIADIPALAGFPSINYFYDFFMKQMSITPAQYRQQHAAE